MDSMMQLVARSEIPVPDEAGTRALEGARGFNGTSGFNGTGGPPGGPRGPPFLGLGPPPPGVTPNFVNPESIFDRVLTSHLVTLSLACIFVLMRVWTRFFVTRAVGWDDFLAVLATVLSIGFVVGSVQELKVTGYHAWDVMRSIPKMEYIAKWSLVSYSIYMAAMGVVKLSILCLYLRIFSAGQKLKVAIYALMFFVAGYTIAGEFSMFFGCRPLGKLLNRTIPGKCYNLQAHILAQAALNLVADFLIVLAPIPTVVSLQLPTRQKVAVIGVFMLGFLVCAFSGVRLNIAINIDDPDFTRRKARADWWSEVELNLAIICSCMPAMKSLLNHVAPRILSLTSRGSSARKSDFSSDKPNPSQRTPVRSAHRDGKQGRDDSYLELGEAWKNEASVTTVADPEKDSARTSDADTVGDSPERDGIIKTIGVKVATH